MKVVLFTDNLGSGGAQRQLVALALQLANRGHDVAVSTYSDGDYYVDSLTTQGIPVYINYSKTVVGRVLALLRVLYRTRADALIAFQEVPAFIAELTKFLRPWQRLIASERQAIPDERLPAKFRVFRLFHFLADYVTTNSHANADQIRRLHPLLAGKIRVIYNAVDMGTFSPLTPNSSLPVRNGRFVVLASHKAQKNFDGLAAAIKILRQELCPSMSFRVDWYGADAQGRRAVNRELINRFEIMDSLSIHDQSNSVVDIIRQSDALILPSFWEGLPNCVCEALACGCPVLMSDVCDARFLVEDGVNGFLFDPTNPLDIAHAIKRFLNMSNQEAADMRLAARAYAMRLFDMEQFVAAYESLLSGKV